MSDTDVLGRIRDLTPLLRERAGEAEKEPRLFYQGATTA